MNNMEKIDILRQKLYDALESNDYNEVLRISELLDELILQYYIKNKVA